MDNKIEKNLEDYFKANGFEVNEQVVSDVIRDEGNDRNIDLDDFLKSQNSPIGDYKTNKEKLKGMLDEIKDMIQKLKDEREKLKEEEVKKGTDDRQEKDTKDEVEGKEQLDADKKEQVEEIESDAEEIEGEIHELGSKKKESKEIEKNVKEPEAEDKDEEKKEKDKDVDPKQVYLNKVKKLHKLKMIDYRDRVRKYNDVTVDRKFTTMVMLEREVIKERDAFIKKYGAGELEELENDCKVLENNQEKRLSKMMEKELNQGEVLNERLDDVIYQAEMLEEQMSKTKDIDAVYDDYASDMRYLNEEKANVMWEINKLNPKTTESKQDILDERENIEKRNIPYNRSAEKAKNQYNKEKDKELQGKEKKQDGRAKDVNESMEEMLNSKISESHKRLEQNEKEIKKYLNQYGKDGASYPEGARNKMIALIDERHRLQTDIAVDTKSKEDLAKNLDNKKADYGDNLDAKNIKEESIQDSKDMVENLNSKNMSDEELSEIAEESIESKPNLNDPEEIKERNEDISDKVEKTAKDEMSKEEDQVNEAEKKKENNSTAKMVRTAVVAGMAYEALDKEERTSTDDFVSAFRGEVAGPMDEGSAKEFLEQPEQKESEDLTKDEDYAPVRKIGKK